MNADIELSTGPEPGWELEEAEEDLNSISESSVLAYTLRRSRDRWLTSVFPKFSGKPSRNGKVPTLVPPPHTMQSLGSCDVEIGPHIFCRTAFYEAHYLPSSAQPSATDPQPFAYQTPTSSWSATTSHDSPYALSLASTKSSSATPFASIAPPTMITPAIVDQVNAAASNNPTLSNLLQLAAAGKANPIEMKTLSVTIQSLIGNPHTAAQYNQLQTSPNTSSSLPSTSNSNESSKEFDLVIEFREAPNERWIIPRGTAICERRSMGDGPGSRLDAFLTAYARFGNNVDAVTAGDPHGTSKDASHDMHMLYMRLKDVPSTLWDTLNRWVGGEVQMQANRKVLNKLEQKQPSKSYLAHHLPDGPLLDQLRAAMAPPYPMKSLKQIATSAPTKPKRIRTQKKVQEKARERVQEKVQEKSSEVVPSGSAKKRKVADTSAESAMDLAAAINGAAASSSTPYSPTSSPTTLNNHSGRPPKKYKQTNGAGNKSKSTTPLVIKCHSCQATDVPLMLGGRYCRPCVEAGRATIDIPQHPNSSRAPMTYTPTYNPAPTGISSANPYKALLNFRVSVSNSTTPASSAGPSGSGPPASANA